MMLPVSSYEELLARVRSLTSETIQLQHEISSSLQVPFSGGNFGLAAYTKNNQNIKGHPAFLPGTQLSQDMDGKVLHPLQTPRIEVTRGHLIIPYQKRRSFSLKKSKCQEEKMLHDMEVKEIFEELLNVSSETLVADKNPCTLEADLTTTNVNTYFIKSFRNFNNNNLIINTSGVNLDKLGAITDLDLFNKNFILSEVSEFDSNSERTTNGSKSGGNEGNTEGGALLLEEKRNEIDKEHKETDEKQLVSLGIPFGNESFQRKIWSPDTMSLWHSGPSSLNLGQTSNNDATGLSFSFTSNSPGRQSVSGFSPSKRTYCHQQLGVKVEMVYNLLSMLDTDNKEDISKTFLAMSSSTDSCHAMRQSGCLPLLIQLIHSNELNIEVRKRATEALHNIVHAQTDEKRRRREVRVLKLLEQIREYGDELKNDCAKETILFKESEKHPVNAIGTLMKFSFDAEHRQAICTLGGLHAVAQLLQIDHEIHGNTDDSDCITLRRYAGMSLTNLTFGDGRNKALLCSFNKFMRALVDQLKSPNEDLRQVTASVLRNLSWRADSESKQALRNIGAVTALTVSAMEAKKESTLKAILSALWNLSAHCSLNKIDICSVPGALAFLVKMLRYKSSSNTLSVVENAGGILRNISSHVAIREDYRQILRDNNCFEVLLEQLKSPSLTIVSNACGTLWNLSARCPEDQKRLWEMGATTMLRSLVQSKHKMISMGSSAALKNLLTANPHENLVTNLDSTAKSLGLQNLPTLFARKKKALEQELNINLAETCDNLDSTVSPTHCGPFHGKTPPKRSESRDSVQSTLSDSVYERVNQITLVNEQKLLEHGNVTLHDSLNEKSMPRKIEDQKLIRRYRSSMIPTPTFKKMNQDRINEKTKEIIAENRANEIFDCSDLSGRELKQRNKKEIPMSDIKVKSKATPISVLSDENIFSRSHNKCLEANLEEKSYQSYISLPHHESIESKKLYSSPIAFDKVIANKEQNQEINETQEHNLNYLKDEDSKVYRAAELNDIKVESLNATLYETALLGSPNNLTSDFHESFCEKEVINRDSYEDVRSEIPSRASLISTSNFSQRCSLSSSGLKDDQELQEIFNGVTSIKQADLEEPQSVFFQVKSNKDLNKSKIPQSSVKTVKSKVMSIPFSAVDSEESFSAANGEPKNEFCLKVDAEGGDPKILSSYIFPKFKVGSPISDSSVLKMEANKICSELKKQQDLDMGCSLSSEMSLVSCSSFLDTGDYSLFDSSTDTIDFDNSENILFEKTFSKIKSFSFCKSNSSQTTESVSLPSLGSHKYDQLDGLDLENSVLSVASITSEIAELNSKDFETCNTFTKTCKTIHAEKESGEETVAEVTLVSSGDDTLNADSLFYEEENSLHSQENLPLDSEVLQLENTSDLGNKKLTPKEKRKTFQERYKTYTIRNFRKDLVCDYQGLNENAKLCADAAQHMTKVDSSNCELNKFPFDQEKEAGEKKSENSTENFDFSSRIPVKGNKYEHFYFSKSFDKEQYQTSNVALDSKSLTDLLSVGPAERKELVDNAKLVAFSLKTAVQDGVGISDSEGEDELKSVEIDTATYSKSNRDRFLRSKEFWNTDQYEEGTAEEDREKKGARVLKPNSRAEKLEGSKGIRGRRKPLYSSPRRNSPRAPDTHLNSPKISKAALVSNSHLHNAFGSLVLHREGTFTKDDTFKLKNVPAKILQTTSTTQSKDCENFSRPLSKNRPLLSSGNSKRVGENQLSKIGRPVSNYASKCSERRAVSDSNQRQKFIAGAGSRIGGGETGTSIKSTMGVSAPKMGSSSSNQNIKAGTSFGSGFILKSRNSAL